MSHGTFLSKEQIVSVVGQGLAEYRITHPELAGFLDDLEVASQGMWGITGGAIRDLIFGYEPNDIDIIVDMPDDKLQTFLKAYKFGKRNRFAGTKIILDGKLTDVWALEMTWGIRNGYVKNAGLASFPLACAFTTDAAVVLPGKGEAFVDRMIESFQTGIVDIILGVTPIPLDTTLKAYRLKHKYSLQFSKKTEEFLSKFLENSQ